MTSIQKWRNEDDVMPKKLTVDPFFTGKEMSLRDRDLRGQDRGRSKDSIYLNTVPQTARETYNIAQAKLKMLAKPSTPDSKYFSNRMGSPVTRERAIRAAQKHAQAAAKRMEKEKKKDKTKNNPKRKYIEG
jgi:hypothetical protein